MEESQSNTRTFMFGGVTAAPRHESVFDTNRLYHCGRRKKRPRPFSRPRSSSRPRVLPGLCQNQRDRPAIVGFENVHGRWIAAAGADPILERRVLIQQIG